MVFLAQAHPDFFQEFLSGKISKAAGCPQNSIAQGTKIYEFVNRSGAL
jgi:hypothetical protein